MPISKVDPNRTALRHTPDYNVCQSKVGSFQILSSQLNLLPFDCRVWTSGTLNEPEIKGPKLTNKQSSLC